mmetsp:Transcript_28332/g.52735  ORF Transcript_28332/g.52735 Transcript_28332/m.52735 type:complete len:275 (+) Transcript_28332:37-861(+)
MYNFRDACSQVSPFAKRFAKDLFLLPAHIFQQTAALRSVLLAIRRRRRCRSYLLRPAIHGNSIFQIIPIVGAPFHIRRHDRLQYYAAVLLVEGSVSAVRLGPLERRVEAAEVDVRRARQRREQDHVAANVARQRRVSRQELIVLLQGDLRHGHEQRRDEVPPDLLDALHGRLVSGVRDVDGQFGVDGLDGAARHAQPEQGHDEQERFVADVVLRQSQREEDEHGEQYALERDALVLLGLVDVSADDDASQEDGQLEAGASEIDGGLFRDAASFH